MRETANLDQKCDLIRGVFNKNAQSPTYDAIRIITKPYSFEKAKEIFHCFPTDRVDSANQ